MNISLFIYYLWLLCASQCAAGPETTVVNLVSVRGVSCLLPTSMKPAVSRVTLQID